LTDYSRCEPLVDDHRLARIEALVRLRFPTLPDASTLVTARVGDEGHFILLSPVPGIPEPFRMQTTKRIPLRLFEQYERERGHYVTGGSHDPVLWVFEHMAEDQTRRLASAAEMNHPEEAP